MVNTIKFSEFEAITLNGENTLVGLSNGVNAISDLPINWTTTTRPTNPTNGFSGYNTSLSQWEFWNGISLTWEPVGGGGAGTVTDINTGTGLTGGPIFTSGTISFEPIASNSFWANTTGSVDVPTVTSLSNFLLAPNNLSDLPNKATARSNLGLAIGTNVEAWSAILDQIAANVWVGSTSLTTLGTITTGIWHASIITVPFGGTGNNSFTANTVICAGTSPTSSFQNVVNVGTAGQVLTSNGLGNLPTWQSTTGGSVSPGLINELAYYAVTGSDVSGLPTGNNGVLITSNSGVPSISSTLPNLVQTNITQLGTITTGVWNASLIPLNFGGTNANLTASDGGIFYSTASAGAILLGTSTANQILLSGSSSAPSWSIATYPASTSINQILYSSSANVIAGLATAANATLITDGTGIPSISATLPINVQSNITTLGTITTGVWNATPITVSFGGTGNTTFTSYSVITAGTTATAPFQNVVGVGTSGQVLTSNGAASLPTWQTFSGSGTVNPGTANDLAYYATTGSAVSALASANGGVLVTSNTGIPSILAGSGVTGTILQATASGTPSWSTATYPANTSINQILYSSAANVISGIAAGANGVLITSAGNVPSISSTLPATVQGNITTVGTIGTGIWNGSTITVPFGGTGNTTFTAYSLICGGTTSTGTFQNVAGVGTLGQVLTSNGAAALPTWQNVSGTGTVNSATANDLAYYTTTGNTVSGLASANGGVLVTSNTGVPSILAGSGTTGTVLQALNGGTPLWSTTTYPATATINQILYASAANVISGLATANSSVLVTNGSGVPSFSTTLPTGLSATNMQLTTPTMSVINDVNGNEFLFMNAQASAVNYAQIANSATGVSVIYGAGGSDTNINVELQPKGAGILSIVTTAPTLPFEIFSGTANQHLTTFNFSNTAATRAITFPDASGTVSLNAANPTNFSGRITLTSGVPVTTSDVTAATTVYFTPYKGNQLSIYNGSGWTTITFVETSIAVPATTSTMYDLFAQNSSGSLALVAVAWTNDTTRATGLSLQNGVYCQTGTLTNLYLGSFRTTGSSGQTEDSLAKRYVWNYYNRVARPMQVLPTTTSWTYGTATYRQANATSTNQLDAVVGVAEDEISMQVQIQMGTSTTSGTALIGIGIDSTTVNSAKIFNSITGSLVQYNLATAFYRAIPTVGRHFYAWLEKTYVGGVTTFYCTQDVSTNTIASGIMGTVKG